MRRILMATTALVLTSLTGPQVPEAEAGFCRIYCESVTVGCKVTFGQVDEDYCENWREGCIDGCRVDRK